MLRKLTNSQAGLFSLRAHYESKELVSAMSHLSAVYSWTTISIQYDFWYTLASAVDSMDIHSE